MGELKETKRALAQKEEDMRQLEERLQRLEMAQDRQPRGRRWGQGELQGVTPIMTTKMDNASL